MVSYSDDGLYAFFNGEKYHLNDDGYFLGTRKEGEARKRLHVAVWEFFNGPVPPGMCVHHKDENKRNNEIENLALMKISEHVHHHDMNAPAELKAFRSANAVKAGEKAKDWHRSEAGKEWHRKHGAETWDREPRQYVCTQCGKTFETKYVYPEAQNHFCSNNCKSAFRKQSGVDKEARICQCCGKEFSVNKYSRTKYCSRSCARRSRG